MDIIIWSHNEQPEWIKNARAYAAKRYPGAKIRVSNPEAYDRRQFINAKIVIVEPRWEGLINDYKQANAKVITRLEVNTVAIGEQSISGSVELTENSRAELLAIEYNVGPFGSLPEVSNEIRCCESNETSADDSANPQAEGIEGADEDRIPAARPVPQSDGLADGNQVPVSRGRGKQVRKAKGR